MHSGAGKSPAEKAMIGPLRSWERDRQAARADEYTLDVARWKAAQKKAADDEKGYAVGSVGEETFKASVLAAAAPRPQQYRLTIDDTTPERLVQLLGAHQRLALISTEAGLLDSVAGAFSTGRQPNVDVTSRRGPARRSSRDRKGGDSGPEATVVDDALLTVVLTIQPTVVERYQTTAPELRGRGFFARFMPSIPRSLGDPQLRRHDCPGAVGGPLRERAPRLRRPAHGPPDGRADAPRRRGRSGVLRLVRRPGRRTSPRSSPGRLARRSVEDPLVDVASRRAPRAGRRPQRSDRRRRGDAPGAQSGSLLGGARPRHGGKDRRRRDEAHAVDAALDLLRWARRHPEKMETGFTPREVYAGLRRKLRSVEELIPAFEHLRDRGWLWFVTGDVDGIGDRVYPFVHVCTRRHSR